jgi:hypothetical protein
MAVNKSFVSEKPIRKDSEKACCVNQQVTRADNPA